MEHMYSSGADYVDIIGCSKGEEDQDEILVAVKEEYMTEESEKILEDDDDDDYFPEKDEVEIYEQVEFPKKDDKVMTEKEINTLINGS